MVSPMNSEIKRIIPYPIVQNDANIERARGGSDVMENKNEFVTQRELDSFKEVIESKIESAIRPLEAKIDNLPTQIENMLLKEREYQDVKRGETNRFIWGTIIIGIASIVVSILFQ